MHTEAKKYLTLADLDKIGAKPKLVHEGRVLSFIEAKRGTITAHGSLGYDAALLLIEMEEMMVASNPAPMHLYIP